MSVWETEKACCCRTVETPRLGSRSADPTVLYGGEGAAEMAVRQHRDEEQLFWEKGLSPTRTISTTTTDGGRSSSGNAAIQTALAAAESRIRALELELERSRGESKPGPTESMPEKVRGSGTGSPPNRTDTTASSRKCLQFPGPSRPSSSTSTISAESKPTPVRPTREQAPYQSEALLPQVITVHMIREDLTMAFGFSIEQPHKGGRVFVKRVWKDSPAETAGLRAGDMVISMDGHKLQNATPAAVATMVKNAGHVLAVEVVSALDVAKFPELRCAVVDTPLGPVAKSRSSAPQLQNPNVSHWGPFAGNYPFNQPPGPSAMRSSNPRHSRERAQAPPEEEKPIWVSLLGTTVQAPDIWTFFLGWKRWKEKTARQGLVASYETQGFQGKELPGEPFIGYSQGTPRRQRRTRHSSDEVARADSAQRLSLEIPKVPVPPVVMPTAEEEQFQRTENALYQLRNAMLSSQASLPGEIEAENRRLNEIDGVSMNQEDDDIAALYNEESLDDADTAWEEFKSMFEDAGIKMPPQEPTMFENGPVAGPPRPQSSQRVADTQRSAPFQAQPTKSLSGKASSTTQSTRSDPGVQSMATEQSFNPAVRTLERSSFPNEQAQAQQSTTTTTSRHSAPAARSASPDTILASRPKMQMSMKGLFAKKLAEVKAPHVDL